jgi:6-phosphofructokinase 1
MYTVIEELALSGRDITKRHGEIYELLGLDVIYDHGSMKIYSTEKAKIKSFSNGIHVHAYYNILEKLVTRGFTSQNKEGAPLEIFDLFGNKIIVTFIGEEGYNRIAIVTSGGDAPGMNAAIRSIVRTGIKWGASVYGVYRGFDGLINNNIRKLGWDTETHYASQGGTVLLSARSKRFMEREGRKEAVLNLVRNGINCLIVLGGDGSLEGALTLKEEFREHFRDLIDEGRLSREEIKGICERKIAGESRAGLDRRLISDPNVNNYASFYGKPECYKANPNIYSELSSSSQRESSQSVERSSSRQMEDDLKKEKLSSADFEPYIFDLKLVGIPASIDNDIYGADITLGADTATQRVSEAIDHLLSTMRSHSRVFVIEVMGRRCGWIALMSALAGAADYVLLPEAIHNWRREMIEAIEIARRFGKPGIFVIVSEGAVEPDGSPISTTEVVEEVARHGIDVRLLKLGHIQRGGPTSAHDRIYGTLLGIKAVELMLTPIREPLMISIANNEHKEINLREVIEKCRMIKELQDKLRFEETLGHRGPFFQLSHSFFMKTIFNNERIARIEEDVLNARGRRCAACRNKARECRFCEDLYKENEVTLLESSCPDMKAQYSAAQGSRVEKRRRRIGVLQTGTRSSGMNTALNAAVQYSFICCVEVFYILNGFDGLLAGQVFQAKLYEFSRESCDGGSAIGLSSGSRPDVAGIEAKIREFELDSLIVIGDAEAMLLASRIKNVNVVLVPASASNNMPCTDLGIGTDTALNTILKVADCSKLNSLSMKRNVFVIEIAGGRCGFQSLMGGIAAGAFEVFIPERKYLVGHLSETAQRLRTRFRDVPRRGIVLFRNEHTFCSMSVESLCRVLKTDTEGSFETDFSVLGHLQSGNNPTPIDKINATLMAIKAVDMCLVDCGVGMVGVCGGEVRFTKMKDVLDLFDEANMRIKDPYWLKYSHVCRSVE